MGSETVYVKLKEEGVNSLSMMNMRFILLNMLHPFLKYLYKYILSMCASFDAVLEWHDPFSGLQN